MKILVLSNIPSPYRIDFFNELGKFVDLTVVFEARRVEGIKFNWNDHAAGTFKSVFLKNGNIEEKKIDFNILKYINKHEYDCIIVTNYSYYTEMLGLLYIKLKRIPYILEIDGGLIRKEVFLKKMWKKLLISNAKLYISPSEKADQYLAYYGANKEKIYRYSFSSLKDKDIMPKPLSKEEKERIKKELGIKESRMVLSVGQFIHRKGFDILLKACKDLEPDVGIYLVGGEPTQTYVDLRESLNLNNIHFVGFKTNEQLKEYYKAADLFVLPTRDDVWGLVINEAMAQGVPVITTNRCVAGLELIENGVNGYLVASENIEELREKINALINNFDFLDRVSINNLKKIRNYTIEMMVRQHLDILENL